MSRKHSSSKLWAQDTLNRFAIRRASEQIQSTGRALPCKVTAISGQIVTVMFDVTSDVWGLPPVKIPIATSVYDFLPVAVGDKGITMPGDVSLGSLSGLGTGTPVLGQNPSNLSSLVFVPVSDASWKAPQGETIRTMQGPGGFSCQSVDGSVSVVGIAGGDLTVTAFGYTVVISSSGITLTAPTVTVDGNLVVSGSITGQGSGGASMQGDITTTGAITAGGNVTAGSIDLETHVHTGVTTGTGNTGGPTG